MSVVRSIAGLVASFIGWAMWQNPRLDWESVMALGMGEFNRLLNDPFAILGMIIMLLGIATLIKASTPT